MTKRFPIILSAFCAPAALPAILVVANAPRPNIVLIMCDDLGYSDVGFDGAMDIRTPSLDALAKNGTICTSGYVTHPFRGPSRMGLMTGRYPHKFGAPFNLPNSGQHPALVQELIGEAERWSRTHTQPRRFDNREAEAAWNEAGMPRYDETFSMKNESPPANTRIAPPAAKSKGDSTLAEFIEKERIKWQTHGWKWNQAKVEAIFGEIDTNDDAVASGREKKTYWEKRRH